jgi:hypothetical protein
MTWIGHCDDPRRLGVDSWRGITVEPYLAHRGWNEQWRAAA